MNHPFTFTIVGRPITKKNSSKIARFGKQKEFMRIVPGKAQADWFRAALSQAPLIRAEAARQGVGLPIMGPVHVEALVYRQTLTGDMTGFQDAIGDAIQSPRMRTDKEGRLVFDKRGRPKLSRDGLGVIEDDAQRLGRSGGRIERRSR